MDEQEYVVTLTAVFRGRFPVVVAQDFREWLDQQGRISVTVTNAATGEAVEIEA